MKYCIENSFHSEITKKSIPRIKHDNGIPINMLLRIKKKAEQNLKIYQKLLHCSDQQKRELYDKYGKEGLQESDLMVFPIWKKF
jgi:hypothetical protein